MRISPAHMPSPITTVRVGLAQFPMPASIAEALEAAEVAIREAASKEAQIVCFPECFVPGYRMPESTIAPPDSTALAAAWTAVSRLAALHQIVVILGTERASDSGLRISTLVIGPDGAALGFQDKVQLDPSEDPLYAPGSERRLFQVGELRFGVVICHEGWRYPETVRWAAQRGAHIVFHPHYHFDVQESFHARAIACRAAENTCYFASVNAAFAGAPVTTAVAAPDGEVIGKKLAGEVGVLTVDIDLSRATGLLASRFRPAALG